MAAESGRHVVSAPVLFEGGYENERHRFSPALARVNVINTHTDTRLYPFAVANGKDFITDLYNAVRSSRYLMI